MSWPSSASEGHLGEELGHRAQRSVPQCEKAYRIPRHSHVDSNRGQRRVFLGKSEDRPRMYGEKWTIRGQHGEGIPGRRAHSRSRHLEPMCCKGAPCQNPQLVGRRPQRPRFIHQITEFDAAAASPSVVLAGATMRAIASSMLRRRSSSMRMGTDSAMR